MSNTESSLQERDCFYECKRCEMEERIEAVMSRNRHSGQQLSQHAACQTLSTDNSTHCNTSQLNMNDGSSKTQVHQPLVTVMLMLKKLIKESRTSPSARETGTSDRLSCTSVFL